MVSDYTIYFESRKIVLFSNQSRHFRIRNGLLTECKRTDDLAKILVFFQTSTISPLYIFGSNLNKLFKVFSSYFRVVQAAGGLVRNIDGEILVIKRNEKWDLPKGKVDTNESFEQAAVREVMEECGLASLNLQDHIITTYHTYILGEEKILKRTLWFNMVYNGNEIPTPQIEENITDVVWLKPSELSICFQNTFESIIDVFGAAGLT